jgi:hypothetical protein
VRSISYDLAALIYERARGHSARQGGQGLGRAPPPERPDAPATAPMAAGYAVDEHGVHHLNVEAPIECAPGSTAFATLHVYRNRIAVHGRGAVSSRTLHFRPSACTAVARLPNGRGRA